ncbi:hypothetical protein HK098_005708 [Nowakowskiella sp. JEL0407]|nr:hypothetical protein HK098_005708 [Nowakowskiella sp. JEL0407]
MDPAIKKTENFFTEDTTSPVETQSDFNSVINESGLNLKISNFNDEELPVDSGNNDLDIGGDDMGDEVTRIDVESAGEIASVKIANASEVVKGVYKETRVLQSSESETLSLDGGARGSLSRVQVESYEEDKQTENKTQIYANDSSIGSLLGSTSFGMLSESMISSAILKTHSTFKPPHPPPLPSLFSRAESHPLPASTQPNQPTNLHNQITGECKDPVHRLFKTCPPPVVYLTHERIPVKGVDLKEYEDWRHGVCALPRKRKWAKEKVCRNFYGYGIDIRRIVEKRKVPKVKEEVKVKSERSELLRFF